MYCTCGKRIEDGEELCRECKNEISDIIIDDILKAENMYKQKVK